MEIINKIQRRSLLIAGFLVLAVLHSNGQTEMPDVLLKSSVKDQLNYLDEHTRIYENYRAIREDMFQKIKSNITDTLLKVSSRIDKLNTTVSGLNHTIDTLTSDLQETKGKLDEVTRTKNSIQMLGFEVNKLTYNSVMWLVILGLAIILAIGFLLFKRNMYTVHNIKKELTDLNEEFQAYRKTSREAREKMSRDHFNEIKKMRGG